MAISPKEIVKQLIIQQDLTDINRLEKYIDDQLRTKYNGNSNRSVSIYCPGSVSPRVRNILINKYEDAGWYVRASNHYDPREGNGCVFCFVSKDRHFISSTSFYIALGVVVLTAILVIL